MAQQWAVLGGHLHVGAQPSRRRGKLNKNSGKIREPPIINCLFMGNCFEIALEISCKKNLTDPAFAARNSNLS